MRSVALQAGSKFVYRQVADDVHSSVIKDALHLLTLAGLIKPVTHSDGNGVPLGAEENDSYRKYLFLDLGLMQTMLGTPAANVLLASDVDFVHQRCCIRNVCWFGTRQEPRLFPEGRNVLLAKICQEYI